MNDPCFKFWLAIGRCIAFTEDDRQIFRVWPESLLYDKNKSVDLMPKFVRADNLIEARTRAHRFIDQMFDAYTKVDIDGTVYPKPVAREEPVVTITTDSLTISESPTSRQPDLFKAPFINGPTNEHVLDLTKLM